MIDPRQARMIHQIGDRDVQHVKLLGAVDFGLRRRWIAVIPTEEFGVRQKLARNLPAKESVEVRAVVNDDGCAHGVTCAMSRRSCLISSVIFRKSARSSALAGSE